MREKLLILTLICIVFATNTMAVVVFDAVDNGDGTVTISYTTTDGDEPQAISLFLSCSGALEITGGYGIDAAYNCFIDYAYSNDPYALGDGDPFADPVGPGALDLSGGATEVSICMGVLDESGNQGTGPTAAAVVILDYVGQGELTIATDTLRGPDSGVVGSEGKLESNLSAGATIVLPIYHTTCMAYTNPDYDTWVSFGRPMCWCYEKQCHGDVDGLMQFGVLAVYSDDLGFFVAAYGQPTLPPGGICADLDHQMQFGVLRVYSDDLGELVKYYGQPNVPPCSGPICVGFDDGWCDENTMPNSEFNFWWVP